MVSAKPSILGVSCDKGSGCIFFRDLAVSADLNKFKDNFWSHPGSSGTVCLNFCGRVVRSPVVGAIFIAKVWGISFYFTKEGYYGKESLCCVPAWHVYEQEKPVVDTSDGKKGKSKQPKPPLCPVLELDTHVATENFEFRATQNMRKISITASVRFTSLRGRIETDIDEPTLLIRNGIADIQKAQPKPKSQPKAASAAKAIPKNAKHLHK